jgi:hypothetical protein
MLAGLQRLPSSLLRPRAHRGRLRAAWGAGLATTSSPSAQVGPAAPASCPPAPAGRLPLARQPNAPAPPAPPAPPALQLRSPHHLQRQRPAAPRPERQESSAPTASPSFPAGHAQGAKPPLDWSQLYTAAKLAQWSGYCYLSEAELQAALQGEPISLVAQGRSRFTSWCAAGAAAGGGGGCREGGWGGCWWLGRLLPLLVVVALLCK